LLQAMRVDGVTSGHILTRVSVILVYL